MNDFIERHYQDVCKSCGIVYVAPDSEYRQQMIDEISAYRQKEYEEREARRQEEDRIRHEREAVEAEERKRNSRKLTARQMVERWKDNTPKRFLEADIKNVGSSRQMKAILDGASALILGSNGSGKTYTAYALAKAWSEMAHDADVWKATELLGYIKSTTDPFKEIRDHFGRSERHLVIDEIDKIFESKADFVYLNYLIDYRYEWMLQTVVLGNGDKDGFIANLGQSIYSRLTGDGGIGISLNRSDRRKEPK